MAPRWKRTTIFFWLGAGVPATARCRNEGNAALPSMATPPFLREYRREIVIAMLLWCVRVSGVEILECLGPGLLSGLRLLVLRGRPGALAEFADLSGALPALLAWMAKFGRPGILVSSVRARRWDLWRLLRRACYSDLSWRRPFCPRRRPVQSSGGSPARRCSPRSRLYRNIRWAAGRDTAARPCVRPIAKAEG